MNDRFPNRNYNRAVDVPEFVMPTKLEELVEALKGGLAILLTDECEKIKQELSQVIGFIEDTEKKSEEIRERIRKRATNDKVIRFTRQLERLMDKSGLFNIHK